MWMQSITSYPRLAAFIASILCLGMSGCGFEYSVTWTPDSKSIIYTKQDGSVMQYNVSKDATRTLLDKLSNPPVRAAISSDGRQMALSFVEAGEDSTTVELRIYDLPECTLAFSEKQTWGALEAERSVEKSNAFWCPTGKRILICHKGSDAKPIVFDVSTKKFRQLMAANPHEAYCGYLNISPIRPDGAGYLARPTTITEDESPFLFVDWEGWEHKIELTDELKAMSKKQSDAKNNRVSAVSPATWDGNSVHFLMGEGSMRIDTEKKIVSYVEDHGRAEQLKRIASEKVTAFAEFQNKRFIVQWRRIGEDETLLELIEPSKGRRRVLVENMDLYGIPLSPSPDGKHIVVQLSTKSEKASDSKKHRQLLLINEDGETVTVLDTVLE